MFQPFNFWKKKCIGLGWTLGFPPFNPSPVYLLIRLDFKAQAGRVDSAHEHPYILGYVGSLAELFLAFFNVRTHNLMLTLIDII